MIKMVWKKAAALMFALCLILSITSQTATEVLAETVTIKADDHTQWQSVENGVFTYANGTMTIANAGLTGSNTEANVEVGTQITITITPNSGYQVNCLRDSGTFSGEVTLSGGQVKTYSFTTETGKEYKFEPAFDVDNGDQNEQNGNNDQTGTKIYNFILNGEVFENVSDGDTLTVSDNFNLDEIDEFYIKKIVINGTEEHEYNDNEYSYSLLDNQNRHILETNYKKISDNYASLRVESHPNDIKDADIPSGKTRDYFVSFYITDLKFAKPGFKGVQVSTTKKPDNYDFTQWNGVDLSVTTEENPGTVTAYYGENTIDFSSSVASASDIKNIRLIESTVPSNAVVIDNDGKKVKVLSNFYNKIPLEIELEDGSIGYVNVERIGIFIDRLNTGAKTFYHGASAGVENMNVDTDKNRICAVFYHENSTTYRDYDLIVNLLFEDGTTETTIAQGVGDVQNQNGGDLVGSDYILWSGNDEEPVEVNVTAVDKGALSDPNAFGGAAFGSGSGVSWINPIYTQEAQ